MVLRRFVYFLGGGFLCPLEEVASDILLVKYKLFYSLPSLGDNVRRASHRWYEGFHLAPVLAMGTTMA